MNAEHRSEGASASAEPFWYELPEASIAQRPVIPYDEARCLAVDRAEGSLCDTRFAALSTVLRPTDVLIFNASRVIAARLYGIKKDTTREVELLLLDHEGTRIRCLAKPMRRLRGGDRVVVGGEIEIKVVGRTGDLLEIEFCSDEEREAAIARHGRMPIPPYIRGGRSDEQDRVDYQNPHGSQAGSIAAPTAGLHFTESLKTRLQQHGCELLSVTLHVGPASFLQVTRAPGEPLLSPGAERFIHDSALLAKLRRLKEEGRRIIAVGTTVVRALETMALYEGATAVSETALFILPGHEFKIVDGIITNFHQPGTTHLLMIEAFLGRALLEASYNHALKNAYRFLSYGDGMCIV